MRISPLRRRLGATLLVAVIAATAATSAGIAASDDAPLHHPSVERWRPLVEKYWAQYGYEDEVEFALMVMYAESQGVPTALNPTSDASGLFQHLPKYWQDRSTRAGLAGADIFDPEANIAVAAWLRATNHDRGWYHWAPVWDRTPIGSWGAETHFDMARGWYRAMGGGVLGSGGSYDPPARPELGLVKTSGDADVRGILQGTGFTWTYEVTNPGEIDLFELELSDEVLGPIACPTRDVPAGTSVTCQVDDVAGIGPGGGPATATARAEDGSDVTATDVGTYQGIPATGLELRTAALPDETRLRFENTGLVDLWALGVWIDGTGSVTCPIRSLAPGEIVTCDVAAGSQVGDAWAWTDTGLRVTFHRP